MFNYFLFFCDLRWLKWPNLIGEPAIERINCFAGKSVVGEIKESRKMRRLSSARPGIGEDFEWLKLEMISVFIA